MPAEFDQLPSGLYVPAPKRIDLLVPATDSAEDAEPEPSIGQQVAIRLSTAELNLVPMTLSELRAEAAGVPFEASFVGIGMIANRLYDIWRDGAAQLALLREVLGGAPLITRYEHALESFPGAIVLSQQQLFITQRLLLQHARDTPVGDADITEDDAVSLTRLLVHSLDLIDASHPRLSEGRAELIDLVAYFVQAAAYDSRRALANEFGRAYDIFFVRGREVGDERVPLDDWAREDVGLTLEEQLAGGFGYHAMASQPNSDTGRLPAQVRLNVLANSAIADAEERVAFALSAPRSWFREQFAKGDQSVRDVAWEVGPFMRRPFVRLQGGNVALASPSALVEWLTFGMYDRLRESAIKRRPLKKKPDILNLFTSIYGDLTEDYCLDVVRSAYADGQVHGDQPYGKGGGQRTPDVAILAGEEDVVLIEVRSGYLSPWFRTSGDIAEFADQLDKLVFRKLTQLGRRIADIKLGTATIPGLDMTTVKRIWPILITASMIVSEPFWQIVEPAMPSALKEPDIQKLVIGDVEDLEMLIGLVEQGHDLIEILRRRQETPYVQLELKRWVFGEMDVASTTRASFVLDRWERAQEAMKATLWPDP
jgi:hypothetical protein